MFHMKHSKNTITWGMAKIWLGKLKEIMTERGLPTKRLSKAAGLSETYVWELFNRDIDPTIGKLSALADALGLPITYFFSDEPLPWPTIRVVGFASGGEEWQPLDDGEELPTVDIDHLDFGGPDPIAIRVRGHSMSPVFRDGDDLICHRHRGIELAQALNRDCVVKTVSNRYFVKHVMKGTNRNSYRLRSYNPAFADLDNVALEWAAPVVWIRRKS